MAVIAVFMPTAMLFGATGLADVIVLVTTIIVAGIASVPFARHLWKTPRNFPESIRTDASSDAPGLTAGAADAVAAPIDVLVDRYSSRWSSDRRRVDLPNPTRRE